MFNLSQGLQGILVFAVPIYSLIVCTMVWRAIARAQVFEVSLHNKKFSAKSITFRIYGHGVSFALALAVYYLQYPTIF